MAQAATIFDYALQTARAGVAAALAISFGCAPTAANCTGFYADLTASAEKLAVVVGGVSGVEFTRSGSAVGLTLPGGLVSPSLDYTGTLTIGATSTTINIGTGSPDYAINIGTGSGTNTITIGSAGDTVLIAGGTTTINATNLAVADPYIVLNSGGGAASANGAGIFVEEGGSDTGHLKVVNTRASWELLAPGASGSIWFTPGAAAFRTEIISSATANRAITHQDATYTVAGINLAQTFSAAQTYSAQIISTVTTGTAPLVIASTTAVANLNASLLLGSTWAAPGTIGSGTPSTGAFTTLAASGLTTIDLGTGADSTTALTGVAFQIKQADATTNRVVCRSWGAQALNVTAQSIGGTRAAPTATVSAFYQFSAFGYDGTTYSTSTSGSFSCTTDGTWSGSNRGILYQWTGTPNGSTTIATWMTLQNACLGIGGTPTTGTTDKLQVYGTGTYTGAQTIDLGTGATGLATSGTHMQLYGADAATMSLQMATWGNVNGSFIRAYAAGGTRASPSATANGSVFFSFSARGYGTAYTGTCGTFSLIADGAFSGSNQGTYWQFQQTNAGSTSNLEALRIQNGGIGVGSTSVVAGNGVVQLVSGTTKAAGIAFATDTFLYRSGSNALKTDGAFQIVGVASLTAGFNASAASSITVASSSTGAISMNTSTTGLQVGFQFNSNGTAKWAVYKDTDDSFGVYDFANSKVRLAIDTSGSLLLGTQTALATNATAGFPYIPTCAGTPTGVPTSKTGLVPIVYDTTNNKFYVYNGAWKSVTLT